MTGEETVTLQAAEALVIQDEEEEKAPVEEPVDANEVS
jgi:hypothetical protein